SPGVRTYKPTLKLAPTLMALTMPIRLPMTDTALLLKRKRRKKPLAPLVVTPTTLPLRKKRKKPLGPLVVTKILMRTIRKTTTKAGNQYPINNPTSAAIELLM